MKKFGKTLLALSMMGVVATAAHCVNSVPAVCAAPPGISTYLDLPFISAKAAPGLR